MGRYGAVIGEGGARATEKVMFDGQNGLSDNLQGGFQKQIEDANYRSSQAVFDGDKQRVRSAIFYGRKCGIESRPRNGGDGVTKELIGGCFAESAGLALKCYAGFVEYHVHAVSSVRMGEGDTARLALMPPRVSSMISRSAGKQHGG